MNASPGKGSSLGPVGGGMGGKNPPGARNETGVVQDAIALADDRDDNLDAWRAAGAGPAGDAAAVPQVGLSLPLQVPEHGEKLTFFKAGGDAKLAVGVRPGETWQLGGGLLWTIVWLLIGGSLALGFARQARVSALAGLVSRAGIALGLVWFFLLPNPWLGFVVFVASAIAFAIHKSRPVAA